MRQLSDEQCEELAELLESAERGAREIDQISLRHPGITPGDAYEIQWRARAIKERSGHRTIGLKMGLTSRAKMRQMGVASPCYGYLADYFLCPESEPIDTNTLIHPRVEPEIALITGARINSNSHPGEILQAIDFVVPAIEVIDSRYRDFNFDLPSVIADNSSSARFVLGARYLKITEVDVRNLGIVLEINGEVVETGAGAAVLGSPMASVAELARLLALRGQHIPAGSILLTGGAPAAVAVAAGDTVSASFQGLGALSCHFAQI
jgi:2-oxo-3-hexenedioate decarboxylase